MLFIGKKLLPWKTKILAKKNLSARDTVDFRESKYIGILYSVEDRHKHDLITDLVETLEEEDKVVDVMTFLGKDRENFDFKYDFFTIKDLSWSGKISATQVIDFSNKKFDYLLYLDVEPSLLLESVLAMSRSKCRVGPYSDPPHSDFYELMIRIENKTDIDSFIDQVFFYINKVVPHGN